MSTHHPDPRQRVVHTAAEMLAQHGLNATSIREIARRANAPLGSTYHHFPGGKHQIVAEAIEHAAAHISGQLELQLDAGLQDGMRRFLAMWRATLLNSGFRYGCPVLAVAVQEPLDSEAHTAHAAASAAFTRWEEQLGAALVRAGRDPDDAAGLAILTIASIEGAIALARAARSVTPWDRVSDRILALYAPDHTD